MDRTLHAAPHGDRPAVLLVVGVNGTGKTTTCGKLARVLIGDGGTVLLGAADTFRAAAADQLQTWGSRVGATTIRADREGADPASIAFEAVSAYRSSSRRRIVAPRLAAHQDRPDGRARQDQAGDREARHRRRGAARARRHYRPERSASQGFRRGDDITGIVLTKLDGTAKGGIVIAVQRELGVPVKLVGLGEGPDDLAPFEPEAFVDAMLG
jgi:fused signal recognition particle receptor